ncbi:MAG: helix-turn-helix domain-containing protein [Pseudomonadales bacterium]|nr:helix-turn-helix domain-containing protein [Pseudomonadales bacterium]
MKQVTIIALPEALASSMTIALEMIHAAHVIHRVRNRNQTALNLVIASDNGEPLTLTGGLQISPHTRLSATAPADLIFIPALWGNPAAAVRRHPDISLWLAQQYAQGATLCSAGTGSYFLAEAGLLDTHLATTHWRYFHDFQQRYPQVKLDRKRFITHENRLYCTGSVNAVRDVMLHFAEQLFDASIADEVARHFTHELKRSYESMQLAAEQVDSHHDEAIIKVQEWLQINYSKAITVRELSQRFNINLRSFNRRFLAASGITPVHYLQEIRIRQARELLKRSNLSIAEIAFSVGYQDISYFSGLFRKLNGVTPNQYRGLVRKKLFNVEP